MIYGRLLAFMLLAATAFAEQSNNIQRMFYNGSLLQYVCEAPVNVSQTSVNVADGTLTNIVVSSNVGTVTTASAHNLYPGAYVTVSGSATSALNASYTVLTTPTPTTYTVTTAGVPDATYTTGLRIVTNAPLYNSSVWRVTVMRYDGSNNLEGVSMGGGSMSMNFKARCSDRASY